MTAVGYLQDYHKSENVQTAIRLLQNALKLDTEYADAYAALGEAAQGFLKQVLAMNPQDPENFFYLAQTYYRLENTDQTLHWLNKAMAAGLSKENIQNTPLFNTLQSSQGFQDMLKNY